ncbi:sensor histidine kinase [Streptococcus loxodontisalivarius]|uniref:histidine kinase n=1 Tax=Streptococcus loxodontisalivarius TaxID=1349415 RepID=A0ABS2PR45_9STRE|nr:HAMP domain-containing sensor histidine kinase [Streptococcus loxodontisalivarius]MBM7642351.1 signal transduction histidine kinase [Streptococcus loxodontisalivarius]
MSLLKRFGAMVSNWLKKIKEVLLHPRRWWQNRSRSSLRKTLFLQPLSIIFFSFGTIWLVFNLTLSYFIDEQTSTAIQNQFTILNSLYSGVSANGDSTQANIFETTYVIVDEDFETQYLSTSLDDFSDKTISKTITNYFYKNADSWGFFDDEDDSDDWDDDDKDDDSDDDDDESEESTTSTSQSSDQSSSQASSTASDQEEPVEDTVTLLDNAQMAKVKIHGYTYVVDMGTYKGVLNDYYIREASSGETAKNYYVFVFANVTPVESMDTWINIALLIIFLVIGLVATVFIYLTSRKTDKAFLSLKDYITRLGNREEDLVAPVLPYKEFNEVSSTVQHMSDMIDANQRSQQVFFQNSSHELRTPLMSIQGYAEGIKEGVIKDEKAAASVIFDESQKMAELVDDILTISKMESTQSQLDLETISIPEILYDLTWRLKNKADDKGIIFQHQFEDEFVEIQADERLIERALMNILSNAVRYAKDKISIETKQTGNLLKISICNNGPAISAEDRKHLFERFYKGSGGNFGIGLAMTKDIVERHGGQIWVESDAESTCFSLTLPINSGKE